jgi:hypothetical protein
MRIPASILMIASLYVLLNLTGCQSGDSGKQTASAADNITETTQDGAPYSDAVSEEDAATIEKWLIDGLEYWRQTGDVPSLIAHYAQRQLGITYVGGLLDEPDTEQLVVTLDGSDCVIYVEMSLAMAMTTLQARTGYDAFRENLTLIRYRDGHIDGYPSRLHYFSDWLVTNQEKGLVDLQFQDEGLPVIEPPDFMSRNRENYRHLANDDAMYAEIRAMEERLAGMQLAYIPQERIPEFEDRFQTGDILGFVTTIEGLDITHTGLVKMDGDRAGFYHASMTGAVIVDPATIHEYTKNRRNVNGIVIARLQSPQD